MKTKSIVNVISFGKKSGEDALVDFMQSVSSAIDSIPQLTGKRLAFDLFVEDDSLVFKGGRYKLPEHRVTFISNGLPENENDFADWAEDFSALVLVCDTKELLDDQVILYEVARCRLAMNKLGRYDDALLLLCNVDEIVDIYQERDYENTQIGVSAAFTTVRYNSSRLIDKYQEKWNSMSNLYLLQSEIKLKTKLYGKILALPPSLFCNFNNKTGSGYIELLQIFINLTIKHFNMKFNLKNLLPSHWNFPKNKNNEKQQLEKVVRLAVVGGTSNGKTYFLADLVTLLQDKNPEYFGYNLEEVEGVGTEKFASSFTARTCNPRTTGVDRTVTYPCRNDDKYIANCISSRKGLTSFTFEFLDIPGELITRDLVTQFNDLCKKIRAQGYYIVEEWKHDSISVVEKVVKFKNPDGHKTEQQQPSLGGTKNLEGINKLKPAEYLSIEDLETELILRGFKKESHKSNSDTEESKKEGESNRISGKELLDNFFDYNIDSVIKAIVDSMDYIGYVKTNNIKEDDLKQAIYFMLYIINATDVVVCDKFALPVDDNQQETETVEHGPKDQDSIVELTNALYMLKESSKDSLQNWSMVLRGADSIMNKDAFKDLFIKSKKNHNLVYGMLILSVSAKLDPGSFNKNADWFKSNLSELWSYIEELKNNENSNVNYAELITSKYLRKEGEYIIQYPSKDITLDDAIRLSRDAFSPFYGIEKACGKILRLPRYFYLSSTPIDREFRIFGFDPTVKKQTKFDTRVAHPASRIGFGTYQFCLGMLLRNKLMTNEQWHNYEPGKILAYLTDFDENKN